MECMLAEDNRHATLDSDNIGTLSTYVIQGWVLIKAEVMKEAQQHLSSRDEVAFIDGIVMKGRRIIMPAQHLYRKEHWSNYMLTT